MNNFYLFTTAGCHLCELAEENLSPLLESEDPRLAGLTIEKRDIMENDSWISAYGTRIPVLASRDENQWLNWPFTTDDAAGFLLQHMEQK